MSSSVGLIIDLITHVEQASREIALVQFKS